MQEFAARIPGIDENNLHNSKKRSLEEKNTHFGEKWFLSKLKSEEIEFVRDGTHAKAL